MRLLAGTLILLLAISIFAFSYDVRVEPFDDLLPPSVISAPGPETNGYLCLENKWMERVNLKEPEQRLNRDLLEDKVPWDELHLNQALLGWENAYEELQTTLTMPDWVVPRQEETYFPSWLGELRRWHLRLIAEKARRAGQRGDCLRYSLTELLWMRREMAQVSEWLDFERATIFARISYTQIRKWLLVGTPSREELASLQRGWQEQAVTAPKITIFFKNEAAMWREHINQCRNEPLITPSDHDLTHIPHQGRFWFKPNRTLNHFHVQTRWFIAHAITPSNARREFNPVSWDDQIDRGWIKWLDPGADSKLAMDLFDYTNAEHLHWLNSHFFFERAMVISLALESWKLDHAGQMPLTLEELVPTYLERIPQDPISGKDIHWDPSTRLLSAQDPPRKDLKWAWTP
jgi:hypothetical protein